MLANKAAGVWGYVLSGCGIAVPKSVTYSKQKKVRRLASHQDAATWSTQY